MPNLPPGAASLRVNRDDGGAEEEKSCGSEPQRKPDLPRPDDQPKGTSAGPVPKPDQEPDIISDLIEKVLLKINDRRLEEWAGKINLESDFKETLPDSAFENGPDAPARANNAVSNLKQLLRLLKFIFQDDRRILIYSKLTLKIAEKYKNDDQKIAVLTKKLDEAIDEIEAADSQKDIQEKITSKLAKVDQAALLDKEIEAAIKAAQDPNLNINNLIAAFPEAPQQLTSGQIQPIVMYALRYNLILSYNSVNSSRKHLAGINSLIKSAVTIVEDQDAINDLISVFLIIFWKHHDLDAKNNQQEPNESGVLIEFLQNITLYPKQYNNVDPGHTLFKTIIRGKNLKDIVTLLGLNSSNKPQAPLSQAWRWVRRNFWLRPIYGVRFYLFNFWHPNSSIRRDLYTIWMMREAMFYDEAYNFIADTLKAPDLKLGIDDILGLIGAYDYQGQNLLRALSAEDIKKIYFLLCTKYSQDSAGILTSVWQSQVSRPLLLALINSEKRIEQMNGYIRWFNETNRTCGSLIQTIDEIKLDFQSNLFQEQREALDEHFKAVVKEKSDFNHKTFLGYKRLFDLRLAIAKKVYDEDPKTYAEGKVTDKNLLQHLALSQAVFSDQDFTDPNGAGQLTDGTKFYGFTFPNSIIGSVTFSNATIGNFKDSILHYVKFPNVRFNKKVSFNGCWLNDDTFLNLLPQVRQENLNRPQAERINFDGIRLSGNLNGHSLDGISFRGADLSKCEFNGSSCIGTDFRGVKATLYQPLSAFYPLARQPVLDPKSHIFLAQLDEESRRYHEYTVHMKLKNANWQHISFWSRLLNLLSFGYYQPWAKDQSKAININTEGLKTNLSDFIANNFPDHRDLVYDAINQDVEGFKEAFDKRTFIENYAKELAAHKMAEAVMHELGLKFSVHYSKDQNFELLIRTFCEQFERQDIKKLQLLITNQNYRVGLARVCIDNKVFGMVRKLDSKPNVTSVLKSLFAAVSSPDSVHTLVDNFSINVEASKTHVINLVLNMPLGKNGETILPGEFAKLCSSYLDSLNKSKVPKELSKLMNSFYDLAKDNHNIFNRGVYWLLNLYYQQTPVKIKCVEEFVSQLTSSLSDKFGNDLGSNHPKVIQMLEELNKHSSSLAEIVNREDKEEVNLFLNHIIDCLDAQEFDIENVFITLKGNRDEFKAVDSQAPEGLVRSRA